MATYLSKNETKEKDACSKELRIQISKQSTQEKLVSQEVVNIYARNTNLPDKVSDCRPITIFRLPMYIREKSNAMHEPMLVSIGPYYHNMEPFRTLEEHKWWCLRDFTETHLINLQDCIRKIRALEAVARQCYSETLGIGIDEFVQMLILDGCFILEFIRKHYGMVPDSFFDIGLNRETILNDILLVENQIPFFILHELFNIATGSSCGENACKLRDLIFGLLPPQILWRQPQISCKTIHHVLHFYYLCMVPHPGSMHLAGKLPTWKNDISGAKVTLGGTDQANHRKNRQYNARRDKPLAMPGVAELHEAGVRFRRKRKPRHLFDVTFENGVMEIPALYIDDMQCVLLANILVFEQISYGPREIISHFVSFLDNLIDTRWDVQWLERHHIIINMIGSAGEAAKFFNQLGKWNLVEHNDEYERLIIKVQTYATSLWPRYRATLMRDYFINPWTTVSMVAGVIFLVLIILQTYYTITSTINSNGTN